MSDFLRRQRIAHATKLVVLAAAAMATLLPVVWIWLTAFGVSPTSSATRSVSPWIHSSELYGRMVVWAIRTAVCQLRGHNRSSRDAVVSLSALGGYGLTRFTFKGNRLILYFFIIGLTVPFQAIMIPLFFNLRDAGLLGTYWAMILPSIALGLPLGIFLMRAFYRGLPRESSTPRWSTAAQSSARSSGRAPAHQTARIRPGHLPDSAHVERVSPAPALPAERRTPTGLNGPGGIPGAVLIRLQPLFAGITIVTIPVVSST